MNRGSSILIACAIALAGCGLAPAAAPAVDPASPAGLLSERSPNPRAFGDPKAPIVMREFSDYQ
ncbi:MAG: hypothetical protein DWI54_06795 [Chloroflexi bacterium]|nr:MAG: hypothetical protein DWI54_06795 [Chloroflexota bacterium]